jgi:hypothetical protein
MGSFRLIPKEWRLLPRGLCLLSLLAVTQLGAETRILISADASDVERVAAEELKSDIEQVCSEEVVSIDTYSENKDVSYSGNTIRLGTTTSIPGANENLEPETFLLRSMDEEALLILGADDRGVLYGVYEFSKRVLGIDALEYWTGKQAPKQTELKMPEMDFREQAPAFKLRGYFDNDNDMLANWKGRKLIVEFDIWKEMIDSLARLRYNYIDIHDLLGRPEYYLRDYYTEMTDYHTDLELVDQVIDYAHSKGLLVQIPMYLGWEFMHLEMDEVCITSHFDRWMEIYSFYLRETPLGKGDLFLARPRHPIYDWAYTCPEEEAVGLHPGPLMEAVFSGLGKLIKRYRPGGVLICDLWQEGRDMWHSSQFNIQREAQMLWADDGFAQFEEWPERNKAYDFGIYVHAGVWKNQVVQDPYPERLKTAAQNAVSRNMTHNFLVNGQSFKPFILNLEAAARVAWDPVDFDSDTFYEEWTTRYFGEAASVTVIQSLQLLREVHHYAVGFREVMKASEKILNNLENGKAESEDLANVRTALALAQKSLELAEEAKASVPDAVLDVFDDQVLFPVRIFVENLQLLKSLIEFNNAYANNRRDSRTRERVRGLGLHARDQLLNLRTSLELGSSWEKWKGWYKPENFRIHTPPPKLEDFDRVLEGL